MDGREVYDQGTYHANVGLRVLLRNGAEDTVPVRATKVGGRTKRRDSVFLGADIMDLRMAENGLDVLFQREAGRVERVEVLGDHLQ